MGAVEFGLPRQLVADLGRALAISVAVESGTYRGDSTRALAGIFDRVVSIELSADLHRAAQRKLADLSNVTLLHGSSVDLLPTIVSDLSTPAVYWLDGHWCGEGEQPNGESLQCPVMHEIAAIDQSKDAAHSCILIDDARLHLGPPAPPFRRGDWPTITQVVDQLRREHDRIFTILDDVIIAGPPMIQPVIDAYWLRKQWLELAAERNEFRQRLWFPSFADAARAAAKALRPRRITNQP